MVGEAAGLLNAIAVNTVVQSCCALAVFVYLFSVVLFLWRKLPKIFWAMGLHRRSTPPSGSVDQNERKK